MESTFYKILFFFIAGSIFHFVMLFVKWNNTKKLREDLKRKQIKSFHNLQYKEISISSGGWLQKFNFGLSQTDVDLIFTNNQIQFLPTKFSFFLYASMLPFDINKRLDDLDIEFKRNKIIFYYSDRNYEHGQTQNKISISGSEMKLGELKQFLETWLDEK